MRRGRGGDWQKKTAILKPVKTGGGGKKKRRKLSIRKRDEEETIIEKRTQPRRKGKGTTEGPPESIGAGI